MAEESNQNESYNEGKERFDLLNQIESLKSKIRQELTLILEHPRTPKEFKNHSAVKEVVK